MRLHEVRSAHRPTNAMPAVRRGATLTSGGHVSKGDGLAHQAAGAGVVQRQSNARPSLRPYCRPGNARSVAYRKQTVLRLQHEVWRATEYADVPGVHWHAGELAGDESRGVPAVAENSRGAELRNSRVHQVGPQAVLLSRSTEGVSDQSVRPADVAERVAGDSRSQGAVSAEEGGHHSGPF